MKKKIINGILLVAMLFAATSAFVSCKDTDADYKSETDAKIAALQNQLDNLRGQVGPQGPQGPQGPAGKDGVNGQDGKDGQNGLTPFIGENGNWWIGTTDTGIAAKGQNGQNGKDGQDGKDGKDGQDGKDGKDGKDGQDGLTPFIGDNGNWWIGTKDTGVSAKGTNGESTDFTKQIEDLQKAIDDLKKLIWGSEEAYDAALVNEKLASIQEQIDALAKKIAAVFLIEVTSLSVEQISNPLFTFLTPFGVQPNVLLAYFGEKARRDLYFPKGSEEPIVYKGEYILGGSGNAGKLYVTVNPSSTDFSGKTLKLVTTGGDEGPVELSPLEASNENLMYLTRGDNAFYETYATISQEKLAKAYVSWEPQDMEAFKDEIKDLLKGRSKTETLEMVRTIYNLVVDNDVPVYRLQAAWGENKNNFTYSPANIAAIAMKPLSYSFDLSDEAEYDGEAITALEKFEGKVVVWGTKSESAQNKIWRFLNKFNIGAEKLLNNINWALQPTLLISTDTEVSHPEVYSIENTFTRYDAGEVKLLPTSWSAEVLAPAFKKFVAITAVDGTPVSADDPVNAGLLGKVIPGSVKEIPFTIEPGKTYKIQYSAMDYDGNIRTLSYVIKGNKVYE